MSAYPSWFSIIVVTLIVSLGLWLYLKEEFKKKKQEEKKDGN